jgi:glycosyltransferase involved in cell wall biosynthesis
MNPGAAILYLTYDGLTDPLGQSQVLPYLAGLARRGHRITIVSCEKAAAMAEFGSQVREACDAARLEWVPLRYRKRPPILSTLLDLVAMRRAAFALTKVRKYDIVHCRSYLTALVGLALKRRRKLRFLFDMRGFWIDERFERGIWPAGHPLYELVARFLRKAERRFFREADAIVSLTNAALPRIAALGGAEERVTVIPCCVDLGHFDPQGGKRRRDGRAMLGLADDTPLMLYVGSVGGAYPLAPVTELFRSWSAGREQARLLFVTRHEPGAILADPAVAPIASQVIVRAASRAEVPALVAAGDCGVSFILPSPCAVATSPTKIGEMLAMGLPVIANDGVGDSAAILEGSGAGVVLSGSSEPEIRRCAEAAQYLPTSRSAPRDLADKWFSLERGIERYDAIYGGLVEAG